MELIHPFIDLYKWFSLLEEPSNSALLLDNFQETTRSFVSKSPLLFDVTPHWPQKKAYLKLGVQGGKHSFWKAIFYNKNRVFL